MSIGCDSRKHSSGIFAIEYVEVRQRADKNYGQYDQKASKHEQTLRRTGKLIPYLISGRPEYQDIPDRSSEKIERQKQIYLAAKSKE